MPPAAGIAAARLLQKNLSPVLNPHLSYRAAWLIEGVVDRGVG